MGILTDYFVSTTDEILALESPDVPPPNELVEGKQMDMGKVASLYHLFRGGTVEDWNSEEKLDPNAVLRLMDECCRSSCAYALTDHLLSVVPLSLSDEIAASPPGRSSPTTMSSPPPSSYTPFGPQEIKSQPFLWTGPGQRW